MRERVKQIRERLAYIESQQSPYTSIDDCGQCGASSDNLQFLLDIVVELESQNALLLKVLEAGEEHVKIWHRERANINNILGCTDVDYLHFFDPCHKPINRHSLEESIRAYRASESEGKNE